jgi:hypothetical protein
MDKMRSHVILRIFSFLTCLVLCLSLLFIILGSFGDILIQTVGSATIVLGSVLELLQIVLAIHLTDRRDRIGWVLHRFSYATLLVMIISFLLVTGGRFLSSFSISGGNLMLIPVIAYVAQASFGIHLSVMSYHFLQEEGAWRFHEAPLSDNPSS